MQNRDKLLPAAGKERIPALDITRGIALLGILLVNMQLFASPVLYTTGTGIQLWTAPWDKAADYFITIFGEGKFYPVFSFLFGAGFYIFMERAGQKNLPVTKLYLRRISLLFLFGILHVLLLWWGDILHFYAVTGLFLLAFYKKRPGTIIKWAALLLVLPVIIVTIPVLLFNPAAQGTGAEFMQGYIANMKEMVETSLAVYSEGSYAEIFNQRLSDFNFSAWNMYFLTPQVLAMFLLGMYAARQRLLKEVKEHRPLLKIIRNYSIPAGIVFVFLQAAGKFKLFPLEPIANDVLYFAGLVIGGTAASLFYISTILLWCENRTDSAKLLALARTGRMALTNYLLQSLICTTIFYGYGLGLYGKTGPAAGILLTLAVFAVQVVLSHYWLKHFLFGPAEWLWRTLTYGKIQPIK